MVWQVSKMLQATAMVFIDDQNEIFNEKACLNLSHMIDMDTSCMLHYCNMHACHLNTHVMLACV